MIQHFLQELSKTLGITSHPGIDPNFLAQWELNLGFHFPLDYAELLCWNNGIEAFYGYFRLFGIKSEKSEDSIAWNNPNCWKFAWQDRCLPYWCFGETAWGDQYAFSIESLRKGGLTPVFFIEGMSMSPEIIAPSFTVFLEKEFLRNATNPYDQMIHLAKQKLGKLEINFHLIYIPSILLGGSEDINNVQKMNGKAAMVYNGDIAVQLDNLPPKSSVIRVEPFEDSQQRMRLKLIWK